MALRELVGLIKQCGQLQVSIHQTIPKPKNTYPKRKRSGGSRLGRNPLTIALAKDPCVYCGGPVEALDHIRPISLGQDIIQPLIGGFGANDWPNRAPSCVGCNQQKGSMGLLEFLMKRNNKANHDRCEQLD